MGAVVTDTHALIWSLFEPQRLSSAALTAFEQAISAGDPVYVSAVSVVEVCYLVEKGKVAQAILDQLLVALQVADRGLAIAPLDLEVARSVQQVPRTQVPEMPDR